VDHRHRQSHRHAVGAANPSAESSCTSVFGGAPRNVKQARPFTMRCRSSLHRASPLAVPPGGRARQARLPARCIGRSSPSPWAAIHGALHPRSAWAAVGCASFTGGSTGHFTGQPPLSLTPSLQRGACVWRAATAVLAAFRAPCQAFRVNRNYPKSLRNRKQRIERRLKPKKSEAKASGDGGLRRLQPPRPADERLQRGQGQDGLPLKASICIGAS
jgi:hypothetical protein